MSNAVLFSWYSVHISSDSLFSKILKKPSIMAIGVVEFSREGYKIRKVFA